MESPTCPKLNPMFEEYLTQRLREYADAEVRNSQTVHPSSQDYLHPHDNVPRANNDYLIQPEDNMSLDDESIEDGFSGSGSRSYLSTASCPTSPSPARHRFNYRPQRPTYDPTRGILKSITEGNTRRLSKLLGRRSSNAASLEDLTTPLTQAIRLGQDKCVISLLSAGADPNGFDDEGKTPLYLLMEVGGGNPEILRILLKFRANPDLATWNLKQTPLHLASKKGFQVSVKHLLAANANPDMKDAAGNTPLMFAAKEGHVNIVRGLVKGGADPNTRNLTNESAVHFAARGGTLDCLKELLELGGDPDERDTRGQTPLILACKGKYTKVVELLLDYECDVNGQDTNTGKTALHWAVYNCETNIVTELLDAGADPNIKDKNWTTPFMLALTVGKADILDILLHARCDVTTTDRTGNTALHLAATEGQANLITSLVEAGISVDLKGPSGVTSVMLAAHGGHVSTARELLKHGANPDLLDRNRASALMYAILSKGNDASIRDMVKLIIRANCDLDCSANLAKVLQHLNISLGDNVDVEERLYSPLEVAYLRGKTALFMMLIKAGSDTSRFKGDVLPFVSDRKPQDGDQRNRWYMLHCLKKDREEIKSLTELCRRPALQFLAKQFKGRSKTMLQQISAMPFGDRLKSFLAYEDINEVESKYNVNLREKQPRSSAANSSTRQVPNPKNAGIHSLRSSFRSSTRFSRNSSARQSLPVGYSYQNGPLASSTPKSTPVKTSSATSNAMRNSIDGRATPKRHSLNFGDHSSSHTPNPSRQFMNSSSVNYGRTVSTDTGSLPRPARYLHQNGMPRSSLGPRTGSSNNLELTRSMDNRIQVNTPTPNYGSLRTRRNKKETEHEKMAKAYDELRSSMIAAGSISDVSSSSSSLSESKQKGNKRRERYGRLDPTQMLTSPTPSSDNDVFFNGDISPRAGNDANATQSERRNSKSDSISPADSTRSSIEDNSSKQRSTLKYKNMYKNNLGIPTAMVSPTVAETKPEEDRRREVMEKPAGEWGLKCLRNQKSVKNPPPPAPELIVMDDHEKELLENIVKETEQKLKEEKKFVPPDERPMKPMSEETRKAIYDKRWARIPNPAIIGDLQFTKNGIKSPRTSTSEDLHSPEPTSPLTNLQPKPQNLRSSLRPPESPNGVEKKEVRFSPTSERISQQNMRKQQNNLKKETDLDDSAIQRWGTMTLDDPEVLVNSENFTSYNSLDSPTGKRAVSKTANNNSRAKSYNTSSTTARTTAPQTPTRQIQGTRNRTGEPTGRNSYNLEEIDNQYYHNDDGRNKNIYSSNYGQTYTADQENRNTAQDSFGRNLRQYSSLRIRGPHANYTPSHMRGEDSTSSLDRTSRKRSGTRSSTHHQHGVPDSPLTSPVEKKEIWSGGHSSNLHSTPEVKKNTPGSKIKMAFLRSKSVRR